jgi:hypothetical protein
VRSSENRCPMPPGPAPAQPPFGRAGFPLTLAGTRKVVVVLGYVGHDAEAVGDTHGDHVTGVQESRDPQLLFSHFKGLECGQVREWEREQSWQEEDTKRRR